MSTANNFSCCLVLRHGPAAALLRSWGAGAWKQSLLLHECSRVLVTKSDWGLLLFLLHDKCSPLCFYYYTECRHFQTSRGRSCNNLCSSVNPVCWPTIGVLFPSCYFKIQWKTNHSNHFEIKSPPQSQQLKPQTKPLYSAWLEKNDQITINLLHWLIYCGWVLKHWSAVLVSCCDLKILQHEVLL